MKPIAKYIDVPSSSTWVSTPVRQAPEWNVHERLTVKLLEGALELGRIRIAKVDVLEAIRTAGDWMTGVGEQGG
jgi:hypothetical protein